ncbi:hypothetical protein [Lentibacillus halophilus]|uniref:hypothetical protein n=1 Tax=Lentibacillus halophilus TaxID=295065 RepID=UPI0031E18086
MALNSAIIRERIMLYDIRRKYRSDNGLCIISAYGVGSQVVVAAVMNFFLGVCVIFGWFFYAWDISESLFLGGLLLGAVLLAVSEAALIITLFVRRDKLMGTYHERMDFDVSERGVATANSVAAARRREAIRRQQLAWSPLTPFYSSFYTCKTPFSLDLSFN